MSKLRLNAAAQALPLVAPFRISGYVFAHFDCVAVTLDDGTHRGRGEASGVYYLGDDVSHMLAELERARPAIEAEPSRAELRDILPAGGARNAVDAALWELEARRTGMPIWALAGISEPQPLVTTFTLSADAPGKMADAAAAYDQARSIKIKLTGDLDLDIARVRAVRAARPDAWLGVDANQGFGIDELDVLMAAMIAADVALVEQPLARGREADLDGYDAPIPIAADESALTIEDVPGLVGRFQTINIKLDKCGGLTEGLMMAKAARDCGLGVMVGSMGGSSLSVAPGFILGQLCDLCDLDAPIFLARDQSPGVEYRDGTVWSDDRVWGTGAA